MVYVSVSVYNDGSLLEECLAAVRAELPDAEIVVVDGRYETWPAGADNSTDETPTVCQHHDAAYVPAGPFDRECDKHQYRVDHTPDDEWMLLLDADERLVAFDEDALEAETAYRPRIFNPLVYGPACVYWPRIFKPGWVEEINRWDAYLFDAPVDRTDAVTIAHRHDLRDRDYREAKYERFANEGRAGRYDEAFDTYLNDEWEVPEQRFDSCPACGGDRIWSLATQYGPDGAMSRVGVCLSGDGCWTGTEPVTVDDYQYLPADVQRGFDEDPMQLRAELLDAGCPFISGGLDRFLRMRPVVESWVSESFNEDTPAGREVIQG